MQERQGARGEISVKYIPVDGLLLNAAYGYTDARFREFNNGLHDYRGKVIPYVPRNTLFYSLCIYMQSENRCNRTLDFLT